MEEPPPDAIIIPPGASPVRFMTSLEADEAYVSYATLAEASKRPDAVLVMEADSGGQILLTCPVRHIGASDDVLRQLLADLESITWGRGGLCDTAEAEEAAMYFEPHAVGSGICGGMGGGVVIDGLWVHEELRTRRIEDAVGAVISGRRDRLDVSALMPVDEYRRIVETRRVREIEAYIAVFDAFVDAKRAGAAITCERCGHVGPLLDFTVRRGSLRPAHWPGLFCKSCNWYMRPGYREDRRRSPT